MNIILPILLICCKFQSLTTVPDRAILYEDSACTRNDECYEWSKDQCHSEKTIEDLTVALKRISKSSASRLSGVSSTLYHLTFKIAKLFKKSGEPPCREELEKIIEPIEKLVSNQTDAIGIVSAEITKMLKHILSDILKLIEASSVKKKNAVESVLGNHIMVFIDGTEKIAQLTSILVTDELDQLDELCQGILSITLATSIIFFLVEETLIATAVHMNTNKNDKSSSILPHVTIAMEQFILVLQRISQCPDAESIKQVLPTVTTSLSALSSEVSVSISSTIGYIKKYPVPTIMAGILDCIIDSLKNSDHLKDTETAISGTALSLFDITLTILSARLACSFIKGFVRNVDIASRNILLYVHAIFVLLANINDDISSCGNSMAMFLTIMNLAVVKVMDGIHKLIKSILSLEEVTKGGSILMSIFEAVVNVSSSVVQCVSYIFSKLKYGLLSVKVITDIMHNIKSLIDVTRNRLNEKLDAECTNQTDYSDIYKESSTIILSFMEYKRNITDVVCAGNLANNDISSAKVGSFMRTIKGAAARLSSDAVGSGIAVKLNEICDESYDDLIHLSTVSLKKWEEVKIESFFISNFYYAFDSLRSIIKCLQGGINVSI